MDSHFQEEPEQEDNGRAADHPECGQNEGEAQGLRESEERQRVDVSFNLPHCFLKGTMKRARKTGTMFAGCDLLVRQKKPSLTFTSPLTIKPTMIITKKHTQKMTAKAKSRYPLFNCRLPCATRWNDKLVFRKKRRKEKKSF